MSVRLIAKESKESKPEPRKTAKMQLLELRLQADIKDIIKAAYNEHGLKSAAGHLGVSERTLWGWMQDLEIRIVRQAV